MTEKVSATAKKLEPELECSSSCKKAQLRSSESFADRILQLQRTAGNQAVQRLIKSGALQTKLTISEPGDIYEQEADRVADQVMRMPDPALQRQEVPEEEEEEKIIQTKPLGDSITPLV